MRIQVFTSMSVAALSILFSGCGAMQHKACGEHSDSTIAATEVAPVTSERQPDDGVGGEVVATTTTPEQSVQESVPTVVPHVPSRAEISAAKKAVGKVKAGATLELHSWSMEYIASMNVQRCTLLQGGSITVVDVESNTVLLVYSSNNVVSRQSWNDPCAEGEHILMKREEFVEKQESYVRLLEYRRREWRVFKDASKLLERHPED